MTGKDVEGIFENTDVFLVTRHHDGMYGLTERDGYFLLLQARRGLSKGWIILEFFFASGAGIIASTADLLDGIAGLVDGAAETNGKEDCKKMKNERVGDEQDLGEDWIVALDEARWVVETNQAGLDNLEGTFSYD